MESDHRDPRARSSRPKVRLLTHHHTSRLDVRLEPWSTDDLPLLERLNEPDMTTHVGGPETLDKVAERQAGYEKPGSRQYTIVEPGGEHIGWVGYWELTWRDQDVWETGWAVVPAFQGRGVAGSATGQMLEIARAERLRRFVHAYPMTVNAPSNAICRKLGFEFVEETDFPARGGGFVRCNDWRFDLFGDPGP
jgi:RimJ/RimL family protein N-acetyltransferase